MENIFSSLVPVVFIIIFIFNIINKANKAQNKSSNATTATTGNTQRKNLSLQEIIRQQIEEQKKAVLGDTTKKTSPPQPVNFSAKDMSTRNSLENKPTEMQRHTHNVHLNKPYNEGEALNRKTLEGTPMEMQRHAHKNHLGASYNEGDALNRSSLEGEPLAEYEDKFDLDEVSKVSKSSKKTTRPKRQALSTGEFRSLKFNKVSVVNGIIMSEILNKRGGRRAL